VKFLTNVRTKKGRQYLTRGECRNLTWDTEENSRLNLLTPVGEDAKRGSQGSFSVAEGEYSLGKKGINWEQDAAWVVFLGSGLCYRAWDLEGERDVRE